MAQHEILNHLPDVLAIIRVEEGNIVIDIDDNKIDKHSAMIVISKLITQYLSQGE